MVKPKSKRPKSDLETLIQTSAQVKDFLAETGEDVYLDDPQALGMQKRDQGDAFYKRNKDFRRAGCDIPLTSWQIDEIIKCSDDPIYFIETYMSVRTAAKGIKRLMLRPYQKELILAYAKHNRVATNASRQVGKTTTNNAFIIWHAIFHDQQNIWTLANKGKTAKNILKRLKLMYGSIPLWLQQGIVNMNSESIEFENGSIVNVSTTTSESARSEDVSVLILDEFARIKPHLEEDFIQSVMPTVSSDPDTKIFIVSSPRGISNTFYKICRDARRKINPDDVKGINGYIYFELDWHVVPERDEAWAASALADLKGDERAFLREYCCAFLGSVHTIVNQEVLEAMLPKKQLNPDDFHVRYYEQAKPGHVYVEIVDIAKGIGRTASTIQVIDITDFPFKQVFSYENKEVDTNDFSRVAAQTGIEYNTAMVFIENNGIGESVCQLMKLTYSYPNLYIDKRNSVGISATTQSKEIGADELKIFLTKKYLELADDRTIGQLMSFVKHGNAWGPDSGCLSDLIMPIVHFGYIINNYAIRTETLGLPDNIYIGKIVRDAPVAEEESADIFPVMMAGNGYVSCVIDGKSLHMNLSDRGYIDPDDDDDEDDDGFEEAGMIVADGSERSRMPNIPDKLSSWINPDKPIKHKD